MNLIRHDFSNYDNPSKAIIALHGWTGDEFVFEPVAKMLKIKDVKWYFPKLKFGHILAVPLGQDNNSPCAYFVKDTNKIPDVLSTEDLW